jgi:hypothetical protein
MTSAAAPTALRPCRRTNFPNVTVGMVPPAL